MNAKDKKTVSNILNAIELIRCQVEEHMDAIEYMASSEHEKFDNMSEGLQQTEKGQAIGSAAQTMESIQQALEQAFDALEEAVSEFGNLEN